VTQSQSCPKTSLWMNSMFTSCLSDSRSAFNVVCCAKLIQMQWLQTGCPFQICDRISIEFGIEEVSSEFYLSCDTQNNFRKSFNPRSCLLNDISCWVLGKVCCMEVSLWSDRYWHTHLTQLLLEIWVWTLL
jgi:hypothetical protein